MLQACPWRREPGCEHLLWIFSFCYGSAQVGGPQVLDSTSSFGSCHESLG